MASTPVSTLFADEISAGVDLFLGGKDVVDFDPLSTDEELNVQKVWRKNVAFIKDVSPGIGAQMAAQETVMVKMGGVAKAVFPELKTIYYPGQPGGITVDFISPQALFWLKNPNITTNADQTCFGAYSDEAGTVSGGLGLPDTWDVTLTAGQAAYLFGTGTASATQSLYYTSRQDTEYHSFGVLAADGLLEVGTTPKLSHMLMTSQVQQKYSPFAIQPIIDVPLASGQNIYQYNTLGAVPLMHNFGMQVGVMPRYSGKSSLRWMGVVFYEYNHLATLANTFIYP